MWKKNHKISGMDDLQGKAGGAVLVLPQMIHEIILSHDFVKKKHFFSEDANISQSHSTQYSEQAHEKIASFDE